MTSTGALRRRAPHFPDPAVPATPLRRSTAAAPAMTASTTPRETTTRTSRARREVSTSAGGGSGARRGRGILVADDFGDADAELLVDDDHLAAGDERAVDQDVDGSPGRPVELDDRAR